MGTSRLLSLVGTAFGPEGAPVGKAVGFTLSLAAIFGDVMYSIETGRRDVKNLIKAALEGDP